MLLNNNLYTIKDKQVLGGMSGSYYVLELMPYCFIYQAHFPGEPITPGVCIVQMAQELVEDALRKKMHISLVKNVKFLAVLSPNQSLEVCFLFQKVNVSEDGNEVKVQFIVTSADETKAKVSMVLQTVETDKS